MNPDASLYDMVAFGACEIDPTDGRLLRANAALSAITTLRQDELLRMRLLDLINAGERDVLDTSLSRLAGGEVASISGRYRLRTPDTPNSWVLIDAIASWHESGAVERVRVTLRSSPAPEPNGSGVATGQVVRWDVADLRSDLVCRFRPDTTLTYVNDAYARYFGRDPSTLIGTRFLDLIPAHAHERVLARLRSLTRDRPTERFEHDVELPDGSVRWQEWHDYATFGPAGDAIEFQSVGWDITDRKVAEEALKESQRRYAVATTVGRVAFIDFHLADGVVLMDPVLSDILGLGSDVLTTYEGWVARAHPDDVEKIRAFVEAGTDPNLPRNAENQTPLPEVELRLLHRDGSSRWFSARVSTLWSGQDTPERIVGTLTDVSERKEAADELRRLSHRLLTLQDEERRRIARELHDLTAQNLFALTLDLGRLRQLLAPAIGEEIDEILTESQTLGEDVLRQVRTLSYVLHPPALEESGLAMALRWYVRGFVQRSGISVDTEMLADIGRLPSDVEIALFRIVQEGLTNIQRHSGSSTAAVTLRRDGQGVSLIVSDRGRGISQEPVGGYGVRTARPGVGIASIRQRIRQLGGRLDIEGDHRGTVITAFVPTGPEFQP